MLNLSKTALGIELGSTRIKAVLIDERHIPVASGDFEWENQLVNGIWTYSMDAIHTGLQTCFARLRTDVKDNYGVELTEVGAIGVSAMMHGYLPFDKDGRQLAGFRTWRNTITGEAAEKLTMAGNSRVFAPGATRSQGKRLKSLPRCSRSTSRSVGVLRTCIRRC